MGGITSILWVIATLALGHLSLLYAESIKSVDVAVSLKASWPVSSPLIESILYYTNIHINPGIVWNYIDRIIDNKNELYQLTYQQQHYEAIRISSELHGASISLQELYNQSLVSHVYAPQQQVYHNLVDELVQSNRDIAAQCIHIVTLGEHTACIESEQNIHDAINELVAQHTTYNHTVQLGYDAVYGSGGNDIILYTDITHNKLFKQINLILKQYIDQYQQYRYVLRAIDSNVLYMNDPPLYVNGYGVELQLKNVEYKVLDDKRIELPVDSLGSDDVDDTNTDDYNDISGVVFNTLKQRYSDKTEQLDEIKRKLIDAQTQTNDVKLKGWDIQSVGIQSLQRILINNNDQLQEWQLIAQNFPAYVTSLSRIAVNSTIKQSVLQLNRVVQSKYSSVNYMSINGISIDLATLDVFKLYHIFARDIQFVHQLQQYKLPATAVSELLRLSPVPRDGSRPMLMQSMDRSAESTQLQQQNNNPISSNRVDMQLDNKIINSSIVWLNDMESDYMYSSWSSTINEFRQPRWPNQLVYIKHNIYNGLLFIDLSTLQGLNTYNYAMVFIQSYAPLHTGIVFITHISQSINPIDITNLPIQLQSLLRESSNDTMDQHVSAQSALLYLYLYTAADLSAASRYVSELSALTSNTITVDHMKLSFKAAIKSSNKLMKQKLKMSEHYYNALNNTVNIDRLHDAQLYMQHIGINPYSQQQQLLCNGHMYNLLVNSQPDYRDLVMSCIMYDQNYFTRLAYAGIINDQIKPYDYIMQQSNVVTRLAPHITEPALFATIPNNIQYLQHPDQQYNIAALSYVVYCDVSSLHGINVLYAAVNHIKRKSLQSDNSLIVTRLGLVISTGNTQHITVKLINTIQQRLRPNKQITVLMDVATIVLASQNDEQLLKSAFDVYIASDDVLQARIADYNTMDTSTIQQHYTLDTVLVNGRIITLPIHSTHTELSADLKLLDTYEYKYHYASDVVTIVSSTELSTDIDSVNNAVSEVALRINKRLRVTSMDDTPTTARTAPMSDEIWDTISSNPFSSAITLYHTTPNAVHTVNVIIDPLSLYAQRISAVLNQLRHMFSVNMRIILIPATAYSEIPLKRYYRYAIDSQLSYYHTESTVHSIGSLKPSSSTIFHRLHTTALLSMNIVDTPESWLISLSQSDYDIDNLQLSTLNTRKINVVYILDYLLINGVCTDIQTMEQPAGLQLQLISTNNQLLTDTVVMQNLGYFQLHTVPGVQHIVFSVQHSTIYTFADMTAQHTVIVDAFDAPYVTLKVLKRADKKHVDLLNIGDSSGGWLNTAKSLLSIRSRDHTRSVDQSQYIYNADDIHVFSLASGFLYERFLKIMMLSVIHHTQNHVHFWFLSNFLSPQFKSSIQYMEQQYNHTFTTHFITYRWPQWLRQQTEKQRIIWGYKILFLDVLFPLSVKRIVYIDSDQIVRSDINELMQLDLHGAPYGYTPFCSDNHDVDGYRFWTSGFWAEHLRGKPYHISALYVIDLDQFRRTRAGDTLRITYDNLSSDPNSLANLDQDLPNYTQHQVPIYSLPQHWLWCQTWCSMNTLSEAKTIDLCNNPLTKKPKLDVARELIPEWNTYDNQATQIESKRIHELKQQNNKQIMNSSSNTNDDGHDEL